MNIHNPTDAVSAATGFDIAVEALRTHLSGNLPWLTNAYGRAFLMNEKTADGNIEVPKIFDGDKGYLSVMPNNRLGDAFSFIIGTGADQPLEPEGQTQYLFTKNASLIFYLNLKKIDDTKAYYFIEDPKTDVINAMNAFYKASILNIFTETVREVYSGFTLSEIDRDMFYAPYAGMRFDLQMKWNLIC